MILSPKLKPQPWMCLLLLLTPTWVLAEPPNDPGPDSDFVVRVENHRLTVKVRNVSLISVLQGIADQGGLEIVFNGEADYTLSADFAHVSLDEGLRRLNRNMNYAFVYSSKGSGPAEPKLSEILIYPKNGETKTVVKGMTIHPEMETVNEAREDLLASLLKAVKDIDPIIREETVALLSEFKNERVMEHLTEVLLEDRDEDVRARAAKALGDFKDQRAIDPLASALQDREVWVRENVVQALGEIGGERVLYPLLQALGDDEEAMRDLAAEVLDKVVGSL